MSRLNSPAACHRVPTKSSCLIPTRQKVELGQDLSTCFPLEKGGNVGQFWPTWPKSNVLGPCTVAQLLRPRRTCSREVPLLERLRQCPLLPHQHSSSCPPPPTTHSNVVLTSMLTSMEDLPLRIKTLGQACQKPGI